MADGAKPDVPTTDRQNEKKKKKHRPFYEAVDAHARRRFKKKRRPFYEAVDAHARRRLKKHRPFYEAVDAHARRRLIKLTGTDRYDYGTEKQYFGPKSIQKQKSSHFPGKKVVKSVGSVKQTS